jgi:cytochrome b pre-mRNA-processing protein 3
MLPRFRRAPKAADAARRLYDAIVSRAREPIFHTDFAVPDTLDGRFDLLTLHAFIVMEALKSLDPAGGTLGTELASLIFAGFDDALRQLGVSDVGIGRRIKAMAGAFYGRLEAYGAAPAERDFADALLRNLYRGDETKRPETAGLTHYVSRIRHDLQTQAHLLLEGRIDFGPLPLP